MAKAADELNGRGVPDAPDVPDEMNGKNAVGDGGVDETEWVHVAQIGSWDPETSWAAGLAEAAYAASTAPLPVAAAH